MDLLILALLLFSLHAVQGSAADDVLINRNMASTFHRRSKRGLHNECYVETCSYEEVREVYSNNAATRDDYWYDYLCARRGQTHHCKVTCKHRNSCDFTNWSSWQGAVGGGYSCYTERRYKSYKYQEVTTERRGNCNGLQTSCPAAPSETRQTCVCEEAQCNPGTWSGWQPAVTRGKCVTQSKSKPYVKTIVPRTQTGSCSGISTTCSAPQVTTRKQCNCEYQECDYSLQWGAWQGELPDEGCVTQARYMGISQSSLTKMQENNCDSISSGCSLPDKQETRKMCNCKYREDCTLLEWGEWKGDDVSEFESCSFEVRSRQYNKSRIVKQQMDNCDGLPTQCAVVDKEETRYRCLCLRQSCDWSTWYKDGVESSCQWFSRVRNVTVSSSEVEVFGSCENVDSNCYDTERVKECSGSEPGEGEEEEIETTEPPTTTTPPEQFVAKYIPIGCYKDKKDKKDKTNRAFQHYSNMRDNIDWYNMHLTVEQCGIFAAEREKTYFGIQFFGECWYGQSNLQQYDMHGKSTKCWSGVGKPMTNFVYKIVELPESTCTAELKYTPVVMSSGGVNEDGVWCTDDESDDEPTFAITFDSALEVTGMSTKGHDILNYVTVYELDYVSNDGEETLEQYTINGSVKYFTESSDIHTKEFHWLEHHIKTKTLVFKPKRWTRKLCMDITVFGCNTE